MQQTINPLDDKLKGQHVKLYAMDSAALHARTLFEFFTKPSTKNHLGMNLYGLQPILLSRYLLDWHGPLHSHLMHLRYRRVGQTYKLRRYKDLNRMPVDFGHEVVRLWRMFISDLRNQGGAQARTVLDKASADAARVVDNEVAPTVATESARLSGDSWRER